MVQLARPSLLKLVAKTLVIFPLAIVGLASFCAGALLMCLYTVSVLSRAHKVGDYPYKESRHLTAPPLVRADTAHAFVASVANLLHQGIQRINFDTPTLAPMAFTRFCLRYRQECKPTRIVFRGGQLKLTDKRLAELEDVNRTVNSSILPQRNEEGLAGEKWMLAPLLGDCNDYAVTKRHQLLASGWPARAVLLSEVETVLGEHHLVAVVRTSGGDLVLDNLTDRIMPWSRKPYKWVRIQTPDNPNYWSKISERYA